MSAIWTSVREGRLLENEMVIDCHTHMGPWYNFNVPGDPWTEGMITAMDACGIRKAICTPHVAIATDYLWGNRIVEEVIARHPTRFAGYCTVNPNYPESEIVAELERAVVYGPLCAIKMHPVTHAYPADGPGYRAAFAFAHAHAIPVLVHTWESDRFCHPMMFVGIGKDFPNAPILLGHTGGPMGGVEQSIQATLAWDNLYCDLTASLSPCGMLEMLVRRIGADRILFGTDMPFIDCRPKIGFVAFARISDDDKRKILGRNTMRLFGL
ncbi:MAG: amidohydrolase family protein [candidate division Zixibacteria bacterium]|nr:amidohydrolase family protein [candidate division Zixibacteria bacterium]